MNKIPFIDLHEDIADNYFLISGKDFFKKNSLHEGKNTYGMIVNNQVDFFRLKKSGAKLVFVACCPSVIKNGKILSTSNSLQAVIKQIKYYLYLSKKEKNIKIIKNFGDYQALKKDEIGFLLHIEGAGFLEKKITYLDDVYKLGVRSIGLTHNEKNGLAGGALSDGNLTSLGKKVIKRCQKLKMIIDLAHLNNKSFYQAINIIEPPFMFSHGGIIKDLQHPRNLNDNQIKIIKKKEGIIGICFAPNLLSDNKIETIAKIYEYLKKNIGIDNLAIGSDFDGIISKKLVKKLGDVSKIQNLAFFLERSGFSVEEIEKIYYKNVEKKLISKI
jgi:membrane dipeptidase